jgi:hypothetical protein
MTKESISGIKAAKSLRKSADAMRNYIKNSSAAVKRSDDSRVLLITQMEEQAGFLEYKFQGEAA